MRARTLHAESLRFPVQCQSEQGKSIPKMRLKSVVDGKQVNIPVLNNIFDVMTKVARLAILWTAIV